MKMSKDDFDLFVWLLFMLGGMLGVVIAGLVAIAHI